ncbi:MAG: ImuA family protein [Lacipirellulaceae bacterium]
MDNDRTKRLEQLRTLLRQEGRPRVATPGRAAASAWRQLVGDVGPRRLVDCLAGSPGSGAGLAGLWLCRQACERRGELVVVDSQGTFYPPAAIAWGVDARRLLVVRPTTPGDALAAVEQSLRSPAVGAVWASLGRLGGKEFRRLLLAAEAGEALGVLVRSARHEPDPSWGDVQLRFDPLPAEPLEAGAPDEAINEAPFAVRVTRTRNRHGPAGGVATLAIDWRTGRIGERISEAQRNAPTPEVAGRVVPRRGDGRLARAATPA